MFRVGQKVVLVGWAQGAVDQWKRTGAIYPHVGEVYTIRAIMPWKEEPVLLLEEISNTHLGCTLEPGFRQSFFRPIVEPKAETSFTEGAPKDSERWDNRQRVVV